MNVKQLIYEGLRIFKGPFSISRFFSFPFSRYEHKMDWYNRFLSHNSLIFFFFFFLNPFHVYRIICKHIFHHFLSSFSRLLPMNIDANIRLAMKWTTIECGNWEMAWGGVSRNEMGKRNGKKEIFVLRSEKNNEKCFRWTMDDTGIYIYIDLWKKREKLFTCWEVNDSS